MLTWLQTHATEKPKGSKLPAGSEVVFTYTVTNTSSGSAGAVVNIDVVDNVLGHVATIPRIEHGQTATVRKSGTLIPQ